MVRSILDYYPYPVFREYHRELLLRIEETWKDTDIYLIIAPTAGGKTALRQTISQWAGDTVMLVPTNNLLLQEHEEYPDTHIQWAKNYYEFPSSYTQAKFITRRRGLPVLMNYHTYVAHKDVRKRTLICDEGHNLVQVNQDLQTKTLWRHDLQFPATTYNREGFERWLQTEEGHYHILQQLKTDDFMLTRERRPYRNQMLDSINLIPLSPDTHPSLLRGVGKLILMSATLSEEDVYDLGIREGKKVRKLEIPSIIPKDNRPLIKQYVGNLNYSNMDRMVPLIANRIKELAEHHNDSKGIIHTTYGMSKLLRPLLEGDCRYMFHTSTDAKEQLAAWKETDRKDAILLASGMSEGIDLKGDEFGWQVITKVEWPSLADKAIRKKCELRPNWYTWRTLRTVAQAYGRICRDPNDYGVTYILDRNFERLIDNARKAGLVPEYLLEVL